VERDVFINQRCFQTRSK